MLNGKNLQESEILDENVLLLWVVKCPLHKISIKPVKNSPALK